MGELTRNHDWLNSPLGAPDHWPQSLRTMLGVILASRSPMFLLWGEASICFYNDAGCQILSNAGKHPYAFGKPVAAVLPEIWPQIHPLIEQVRTECEANLWEDQLLSIHRNGRLEETYWTYSYSPVLDENGTAAGVLVTALETTEKIMKLKRLEERENDLHFAIEATELGTWDYDPRSDKFKGNNRLKSWFGLLPEEEIPLGFATNVIVEKDRSRVIEAIQQALQYASGGFYDIEYTIINPLSKKERMVRAKGRAWFDAEKIAYRFNGTLQDISEQVARQKKLAESESKLRSIIAAAPAGIGLFRGRELVIEMPNQTFINIVGKGPDIAGKPLREVMPELLTENQPFLQILDNVYTTGQMFQSFGAQVKIVQNGVMTYNYYNITYTPVFDDQGNVYAILDIAVDVTEQVLAEKALEESEQSLRKLILQAPVGICIVKGAPVVVEAVNDMFLEIVGRERDQFENQHYWAVLQEAAAFYEPILKNVFTTGIAYKANEQEIRLMKKGVEEVLYINFVYEPIKESNGAVRKVMIVALDVTHQVRSRLHVKEAEERARLSISAADLGTFEVNLLTNEIITSQRLDDIFGVEHTSDRNRYVSAIHPDDLTVRADAYEKAYQTGILDYEGRIINKDGSLQWVRSKGRVFFDAQNTPVRLFGVSQDITEQRLFERELNKQVTQRTSELQAINRELERSNANLEEFAHAASHDLKEPIRKIHFFTDKLKSQLEVRLSEDEKHTFGRIENASRRMSILVDDLLLYSHVSQRPHEKEAVNLNVKLKKVLEDLELDIDQKKATILIDPLPTVKGYRRQLQQLFQNLISNALKYSKPGMFPEIRITAHRVTGSDIKTAKAVIDQNKPFHLIEVRDNGIGFEQTDAERIFNIFTRLHSNTEYKGTGVGLSIVRKVMENHNGIITATSEPGKGATFNVYLPED